MYSEPVRCKHLTVVTKHLTVQWTLQFPLCQKVKCQILNHKYLYLLYSVVLLHLEKRVNAGSIFQQDYDGD